MATIHWKNGAAGDWAVAANWDTGAMPTSLDAVTIDAPGTYTATISGADAAQSLTLNDAGATVMDTGTLTLAGALTVAAGTFDLAAGGIVNGGTLSATGGSFAWNGGTLSGSTYQGTLDLTAAGASLTVANGLTATGAGGAGAGTINADGLATSLTFAGTQTIDNVTINAGLLGGVGGTAIDFGDLTLGTHATLNQVGGSSPAFSGGSNDVGTSLTNNGTIQASATGGANFVTTTFVNNGLISTVPGAWFTIAGTNVTNNGTISGDVPINNLGTFTNIGTFTNNGVMTETGGGGGGAIFVNNGVFNDAGGFGATPDGWFNNGVFNVSPIGQAYLALEGGAIAPVAGLSLGTINLAGVGGQLRLIGSQSWQAGTINVGGTGQQITESAQYPIVGATNQLILGAQTVMNHTAGASTFNTGQLTLNGNINASAAGGLFTLNSGSLIDNGSINVSGGDHLVMADPVTGTGKITLASGGIAEFASSVANTDATVFTDTSNATLRLGMGTASGFKSVIQGFTNGNTIDLAGVTATSATWSNGVLTVSQGAATVATLAMAGNYAGATFHVANDGILATWFGLALFPGTNITVTGAGAPPPPRFYDGAGATLSADEGSAVNAAVASFTDSNAADTASQLSATIAWGDGTASAGIVTGGAGLFSVAPAAGYIYADEGSYATSIAIANSADNVTTTLTGGVTATEADVLTAGVAPSIAAIAGTAFNGSVATFTDSYTANTASDFAATINWGDGTSSAGIITDVNGAISVAGSHTYSATGNDVLSVTLNDTHGTAAATATGSATVTAPTVNAATGLTVLSVSDAGVGAFGVAPPLTINSNSATETTIPGTVSASSTAVAYSGTASVNTAQTVTAGWTSSTAGTATFVDTWSSTNVLPGVNNAEQSYGLQGGPDYANATFSVSMAAAGSFSIAWTATENGTGATSSWGTTSGPVGEFGLMNMVVSIDGGAAMQVANAAVLSPSGSFTGALSAGAHTIKVMDWSNYSGANANASGSLTEILNLSLAPGVAPPPLRVYGGAGASLSAVEGGTVTTPVASFTDSNTADTASQLSATIAWGDGSTTAGTVTGSNGVFSVSGASGHVYAAEGKFVTNVTVTNAADGVTTALTGAVTSTDADVFTPGAAQGIAATAGLAFNGTVATFTDSYTANTASDLTATIAWGDGTSSAGTVTDVNGSISVSGSHTYAKPGIDAVSVTLNDTDGTAAAIGNASVTVASPYFGSGAKVNAPEGTAVTAAVASFTDANTADTASAFTATIAWGDGTASTGVVTGSNGAFSIAGASGHVYAAEGSYTATTTVTHTADSAQLVLTGAVTASEADSFAGGTVPAIAATAGKAYTGTVATFTDLYTANTAADLTATITWGDGTTSIGTVTDVNGAVSVSGSHTYAAAGTDAVSVTLTDKDGTATANAVGSATVAAAIAVPPGTYNLTTKQDNLVGGAGNNTFVATTNTLTSGDVIRGGTGVNTLQLSGGGVFNLAAVDILSNIQVVAAQEGFGPAAQTVTLREKTAFTVNVASGPTGSGIVIYGAQNHDIINLGAGNDTIVMGAGETANGGGGNAIYKVNQDSIFDTINGGTTGTNTLVITVGGDQAMGANITGMTAVQLTAKTHFTSNATANMSIAGSAVGGDTITLGAGSQSVISGGPAEKILATAANGGALVTGVGAGSTLEITSGGTVALNAATSVGTVKLDAATNLTLSKMSFITAAGSSGADTITAGSANQTLTGGGGADTLIGFSGGYDTFSDKASGLNGDTIKGFLATDQIDVTDLAFAGALLTVAASGLNTQVTLTSGSTKSVFTLAGSLSATGFHLASDGASGTLLTHS
jgi:hypothetical protein